MTPSEHPAASSAPLSVEPSLLNAILAYGADCGLEGSERGTEDEKRARRAERRESFADVEAALAALTADRDRLATRCGQFATTCKTLLDEGDRLARRVEALEVKAQAALNAAHAALPRSSTTRDVVVTAWNALDALRDCLRAGRAALTPGETPCR